MNLRYPTGLDELITEETDAIFHLAAIKSSHAEQDPDLGYEINFSNTKYLEICRKIT